MGGFWVHLSTSKVLITPRTRKRRQALRQRGHRGLRQGGPGKALLAAVGSHGGAKGRRREKKRKEEKRRRSRRRRRRREKQRKKKKKKKRACRSQCIQQVSLFGTGTSCASRGVCAWTFPLRESFETPGASDLLTARTLTEPRSPPGTWNRTPGPTHITTCFKGLSLTWLFLSSLAIPNSGVAE